MSKHNRQSQRMRYFSTLAGPYQKLQRKHPYKVSYSKLNSKDNILYRFWVIAMAYMSLGIVLAFTAVLFRPEHWIIRLQPESSLHTWNLLMLVCLVMLQIFVIIGTISATRSTLKARNPIPVRPPRGLRVAFVTTRAPGEPIDLVRTTLEAAKRVRYKQGTVEVWLLDETKDPALKTLCRQTGVKYFSRKNVAKWNTLKPKSKLHRLYAFGSKNGKNYIKPDQFYATRTKHGNFNAWLAYLESKHIRYDILAGVDTDHVPEPNFLERILGYFRDDDVAFVVGPQVYGNYTVGASGLVTRWAESQASFFQSTIQRAGNASKSPMFVGTNYAVRIPVLQQIRGFQPCITEDMATGLAIHASRNPSTGNHWESVYTPDVLAVGEGPEAWAPFFTQQWRWAGGSFDTWRCIVWKLGYRIPFRAMLHYLLMLVYYPISALTWILAVASSLMYLTTGATAILAPWGMFMALYLMSMVMQLSLYFWNRRFNVSPHEPEGSYGVAGMVMSSLVAPVYSSALMGILVGKKPNFVVTAKGGGASLDRWTAFRVHLQWAIILAVALGYGIYAKNDHPAMLIWVGCLLAVCLLPCVLALNLSMKSWSQNLIIKLRPESKGVHHA